MAISDRAVLVSLKVRTWTGQQLDRTIAQETANAKKAAADTVSATRILVPKRLFKDVQNAGSKVRSVWTESTSPWLSDGSRILPGRLVDRFAGEMNQATAAFKAEAEAFARTYQTYVDSGEARRRLGELYDAEDFPDSSRILDRFAVETTYLPVPNANDWRLDDSVALEQQQRMQAQLEERMQALESSTSIHWLEKFHRLMSTTERGLAPKKRLYRTVTEQLDRIAGDIAAGRVEAPDEVRRKAVFVQSTVQNAMDAKPGSSLRESCRIHLQDAMNLVQTAIERIERESNP